MRLKLLFLLIFLNSFLAYNQITLDKIDNIKINDSYQLISIDNIGELYFLGDDMLRKGEDYVFYTYKSGARTNFCHDEK